MLVEQISGAHDICRHFRKPLGLIIQLRILTADGREMRNSTQQPESFMALAPPMRA